MDISMYAGDSKKIVVKLVDENSEAINLLASTIVFVLKLGSSQILSKAVGTGITITNAPGGAFTIAITNSDTAALSGAYTYGVRVTTSNADSALVLTGTISVTKGIV